MIIRKGNKEYTITERRECWVLSCKIGGLSVEYKVPKDICADEEELRVYVEAEVWGDRIFEKCGIRRDEEGDGGKTLEIRGKRRLSARDGGANYQQS